jgi:hypothetical protein
MKMVSRLVMVVAMVGALGATTAELAVANAPQCKKEEKKVASTESKFEKAASTLAKWLDRIDIKVGNYLDQKQNALTQYEVARATKNQCDGNDFIDGLLGIIVGGKKFKSIFACRAFWQKIMAKWNARAKGIEKKSAAYEKNAEKKTKRLDEMKEIALAAFNKAKADYAACSAGSVGATPTPTPTPTGTPTP